MQKKKDKIPAHLNKLSYDPFASAALRQYDQKSWEWALIGGGFLLVYYFTNIIGSKTRPLVK